MRRWPVLLVVLGLIWGASFMFIKVGVRELEPVVVAWARLALGAVLLAIVFVWQQGPRPALAQVRATGVEGGLLGVVNNAIPFALIAWGETHIDSGVAAIANATVPIFVALLALRFARGERSQGLRLAGVLLGLVGVAVLTGVHPRGGWLGAFGTLAVVLACVLYAAGVLWSQRVLVRVQPLALATTSLAGGALVLTPFALAQLPSQVPSWKPLLSVVALGVFGTAIAMLLWYTLVALAGSARASLVTYLQPVFAVVYGVVLLGEAFRLPELVGMVLILGGVALGSGGVALARRRRHVPAPAQ